MGGHQAFQQEEIAVGALGHPEDGGRHLVGCVIDRRYQRQAWSAPLYPVVRTGMDLREHPCTRVAGAPLAMRLWHDLVRRSDPLGVQDAEETRSREDDAFPLGQQFAQVLLVAALIGRRGQRDHPLTDCGADGMGRRAPRVAVLEGGGPRPTIGSQ